MRMRRREDRCSAKWGIGVRDRIRSSVGKWLGLAVIVCAPSAAVAEQPFSAEQIEFFEKDVRPIFVEHCQECHSPEERSGGLTIASREQLLKGGDTGPAIVPGKPDESELIVAVRYDPSGYQMPPDGKLPDELVATLTRWVEMGAPWPEGDAAAAQDEEFDLWARAERWAFQPLADVRPPDVALRDWARTPIDLFLFERLEEVGLYPGFKADRRTWLRRAYLDTIGLPPTPEQVEAFLADRSPDAESRVVDELLASPHFGERWGRHWLDLVRYAESRGHEFDYDVANPWHYRDYVIAALNDDVPYDRFVVEHVAGDLLPSSANNAQALHPLDPGRADRFKTRFDPSTGANESILATGFWFFGEWVHSPVDIRQEEAERFENMIDVYSKTFLGLTVACARCHDHKFDPIRQHDYYALQGFLQSSAYRQARYETMEHNHRIAEELDQLEQEAGDVILEKMFELARIPDQVRESMSDGTATSLSASPTESQTIVDYSDPQAPLLSDGPAFGPRVVQPGDITLSDDPARPIARVATFAAVERDPAWNGLDLAEGTRDDSARLDGWRRAGRTLRTPTFEIREPRVYALIDGGCNAYIAVDSHVTINGPLHGSLLSEHPAQPGWRWIALDVSRYVGHGAHVEFIARGDEPLRIRTVMQATAPTEGALHENAASGETALASWIVENAEACGLTTPTAQVKLAEVARPYIERRRQLLADVKWRSATAPAMIDGTGANEYVFIRGNWRKPGDTVARRFLEVFSGPDGDARLSHNAASDGAVALPTSPVSLDHRPSSLDPPTGSSRLELALQMVNPQQTPIVPRVIVNRVWQHYFGRGIVPTSDDFGHMGADPSHPELLDWLAGELVAHDWSLKHIHRLILLSAAYRMESSVDDDQADAVREIDPTNRLLHHMPIKRLEGEIIRDQLLAVSRRLDRRIGGPSVPVHLTPFMEGRGRPGESGPIDGNGRRSLYVSVRRNFPDPFFQAFDFPNPHSTIGRRSVSNVPAQALAMMNNPFVVEQCRVLAERLLTELPQDVTIGRIDWLYEAIYCRRATPDERTAGLEFIDMQTAEYQTHVDDPRIWADYCHVLINVKEFVFVQ